MALARKVLVAGATGVVGASVTSTFVAAGWEVHGAARRPPALPGPGVSYHSADLLDADSCVALADAAGPIDELAYCAINEAAGSLIEKWTDPDQVRRNGAMFANLLDAVLARSPGFRHVSIIHGTKAYAVHIPGHVAPVPMREDQPRIPHDNFYFEHEDEVARRAVGQPWSWTVFRAPVILGGGVGTNLSIFLALGVLAAIAREQGRPLDFPGDVVGGILQVVDADLIARAFLWAAGAPAAAGQIFNVTNGDVAQWRSLWPVIAEANGVAVGADTPGVSCAEAARDLAPVWASLVARYGLAAPADLAAFLGESFALADFALDSRLVGIQSTIKLRKAGFQDCEDTPDRTRAWYDRWRAQKLLPPL